MNDITYDDIAPFDQTDDLDKIIDEPTAHYDTELGLVCFTVDIAERLDISYRNMGEYEPPRAMVDVTPANAEKLRDSLTRALAERRRAIKRGVHR